MYGHADASDLQWFLHDITVIVDTRVNLCWKTLLSSLSLTKNHKVLLTYCSL